MPAIQVIGRVDLPKNVSISGVSGTLWTGKAQTIVVNGLPINNVNWELSPLALLIGKVSAHVKAVQIRFQLRIGGGNIQQIGSVVTTIQSQ